MGNVELPIVEVRDSRTDIVFLLADNSYLYFEIRSTYNESDLVRFAHYDLRLYTRDGRTVTTVIIYPAGIKTAKTDLTIGSLQYRIRLWQQIPEREPTGKIKGGIKDE